MVGSKATIDRARRPPDDPAGRLRGRAGPGRRSPRRGADRAGPRAVPAPGRSSPPGVQGLQAVEPLTDPAAEPPGLCPAVQGVEELTRACRLGPPDLVAAAGGNSRRPPSPRRPGPSSAPPRRYSHRPARGRACTTARTARRTRPAATGSADLRRTAAARRPARPPSRTGRSGPWPGPSGRSSPGRAECFRSSCRGGGGRPFRICSISRIWSVSSNGGRSVSSS